MYEPVEPLKGPFVGVRIKSDITNPENQALVNLIQERFEQYGPVRLLVVYDADHGLMGAESLYDNLRFAKQMSEKLAKMAVIGKRDWANTWIALFGLFGGIEANYFDLGQLEAAFEWLKA